MKVLLMTAVSPAPGDPGDPDEFQFVLLIHVAVPALVFTHVLVAAKACGWTAMTRPAPQRRGKKRQGRAESVAKRTCGARVVRIMDLGKRQEFAAGFMGRVRGR